MEKDLMRVFPSVALLLSFLHSTCSFRPHYDFTLQKNTVFISTNPKSQSVFSGENLTLTCAAKLSSTSRVKVHWRFNNNIISSNYSLSDNFITSVLHKENISLTDSGFYECLILDGIDSSEISAMTTLSKPAHVRVLKYHLKGKTFRPITKYLAEDVLLPCDRNGLNSSAVTWYKDGWESPINSIYSNGSLLIYDMTLRDEGIYHCSFSDYDPVIIFFNVSLNRDSERYPRMNNSKRILEKYVYPSPFAGFVTLDCPIESGSNITQVWYRNGVDITKQVSLVSDGGNLIWRYNNTQFKRGAVAGLYQCFISNILGSDYSITRVLILGFSNPPEHFECKALDQIGNPEQPRIVLSWNPPNLNTKDITKYIVSSYGFSVIITDNTSHEILLSLDYQPLQLYVSVYKEHDNPLDWDGTPALCTITETTERRTTQENARRAEVTCPNGSTNGTILWRSPQLPYSFINVFLSDYMLRCVCLLGSNFSICASKSQSLEFYEITEDNIVMDLAPQVSGSLCLYGGNYNFQTRTSTNLKIPFESCIYPLIQSEYTTVHITKRGVIMNFDVAVCHPDNRLAISCNTSSAVLHVSWQNISGDSINVQLSGNCILDNFTIMSVSLHKHISSISQVKISDTALIFRACSFAVNIKDNSGTSEIDLQCYNFETSSPQVGHPSNSEPVSSEIVKFSTSSSIQTTPPIPYNETSDSEVVHSNGTIEKEINSHQHRLSRVTTEMEGASTLTTRYMIMLATTVPAFIGTIIIVIIVLILWILRYSGRRTLSWQRSIHAKTFPETERISDNCALESIMKAKYSEDARSDITVLDSLNKGCQINARLSDDSKSDYRHSSSTYFDDSYIGTQSSGYGTESDVSFREYFLARDI